MKLHIGTVELPGTLRFISDGYWFQESGEPRVFRRYSTPQAIDRDVESLWGVSWRGGFIGFMRVGKPRDVKIERQIEKAEGR
jgi:hypothetical protein